MKKQHSKTRKCQKDYSHFSQVRVSILSYIQPKSKTRTQSCSSWGFLYKLAREGEKVLPPHTHTHSKNRTNYWHKTQHKCRILYKGLKNANKEKQSKTLIAAFFLLKMTIFLQLSFKFYFQKLVEKERVKICSRNSQNQKKKKKQARKIVKSYWGI